MICWLYDIFAIQIYALCSSLDTTTIMNVYTAARLCMVIISFPSRCLANGKRSRLQISYIGILKINVFFLFMSLCIPAMFSNSAFRDVFLYMFIKFFHIETYCLSLCLSQSLQGTSVIIFQWVCLTFFGLIKIRYVQRSNCIIKSPNDCHFLTGFANEMHFYPFMWKKIQAICHLRVIAVEWIAYIFSQWRRLCISCQYLLNERTER